MDYLLIIAGLVLTVFGSDWLVKGASSLAKRLNVSDLIIGLTIVAFGTSAPELTVNIFAAMSGKTEIAIGNILGSNIFNVFIILGIAAIIYPVSVKNSSVAVEIPLSFLAAIVVWVCANDVFLDGDATSAITRVDGIILLLFFGVFMYYTVNQAISNPEPIDGENIVQLPLWKASLFISVGLAALFFGGKFFVDGAVGIATAIGISESVIGLTIVAAGTSLPELATSAMAAYRKNSDIAIGNVVGSNIFNIFFILGISSTVSPLPFNPASNIDIMMTIFASVMMFAFTFLGKGRQISRVEGGIFIAIYMVYLSYLIINVA
jgi:cation:H+ antiporter